MICFTQYVVFVSWNFSPARNVSTALNRRTPFSRKLRRGQNLTTTQELVMYRSIPKPPISPPGKPWGIWLGQIPRYIASLDGQTPHPLELQRGSNPPPSRYAKATVETSSAKFSATTNNFLVQLVFAPHLKQRHIPQYNYIKWQQQKNPSGIDKSNDPWPMNAAHVLNQRIAKSFCFRPLTHVLTRKSNAPPGGPHFGSNSPLYGA